MRRLRWCIIHNIFPWWETVSMWPFGLTVESSKISVTFQIFQGTYIWNCANFSNLFVRFNVHTSELWCYFSSLFPHCLEDMNYVYYILCSWLAICLLYKYGTSTLKSKKLLHMNFAFSSLVHQTISLIWPAREKMLNKQGRPVNSLPTLNMWIRQF